MKTKICWVGSSQLFLWGKRAKEPPPPTITKVVLGVMGSAKSPGSQSVTRRELAQDQAKNNLAGSNPLVCKEKEDEQSSICTTGLSYLLFWLQLSATAKKPLLKLGGSSIIGCDGAHRGTAERGRIAAHTRCFQNQNQSPK